MYIIAVIKSAELSGHANETNIYIKMYVNYVWVCPTFECANEFRSLACQNKSVKDLNF